MKKRFATLLMGLAVISAVDAQTAREEIDQNPWLAGSNYLDYDRQLP